MKVLFWLIFLIIGPQIAQAVGVCHPRDAKAIDGGISVVPPGLWASRWCKQVDGSWGVYIDAISASDAVTVGAEWMATLNADDYAAAIDALRLKYPQITGDVYGPTLKPIWASAEARIMSARPPTTFPPPVWKVAPNGTAKTRQWYAIDPYTLLLGTKTSGAVVGTQCWPDVGGKMQVEAGKEVFYLPFGATAAKALNTRVTVCARV